MVQQTKRPNTKILTWVCGIYLVPVVVAVLYTWFLEGYPLDFSLTVSLYVARYPWTAVLFFAHIVAVCLLLMSYLRTIRIQRMQKMLYYLVLLCILGCAIFPCNRSRSVLTTQIHDILSYVLVIATGLSFAGMLVFARRTKQRLFAIVGLLFTAVFIVTFVGKVPAVKETVFIWENLLLLLFVAELFLEKDSAISSGF